jgi:hypothetical protein
VPRNTFSFVVCNYHKLRSLSNLKNILSYHHFYHSNNFCPYCQCKIVQNIEKSKGLYPGV